MNVHTIKHRLMCRGSRNALQGCINDAHCMRYLLMSKMGFTDADVQMLTDDLPFPAGWPTRGNMLYQVGRSHAVLLLSSWQCH